MTTRAPRARVLVVATEATARRWTRRLRADGIAASACPWSRVVAVPGALRVAAVLRRGGIDHVLLTSQHALVGVRALPRRSPTVLAVGPATARAARAKGLRVACVTHGTGAALAHAVVAGGARGRVLWLRGREASQEAAEILRGAGLRVDELVTYDTVAREGLAAAVRLRGPVRAWVVGSPAAARALRSALGPGAFPPPLGGPPVLVPGPTTAAALRVARRVVPTLVPDGPGGFAAALRRRVDRHRKTSGTTY